MVGVKKVKYCLPLLLLIREVGQTLHTEEKLPRLCGVSEIMQSLHYKNLMVA